MSSGTSLVVQCLRLRTSTAGCTDSGSIPSRGTKIPHAMQPKKKYIKKIISGFPGGAVVENLLANAGNTGSSPGLGRFHMPRSN